MDDRVFKRINVFKGFIRTAKDYRDGVGYHLRKRRLHGRSFHGYGIVAGVRGSMQVRQRRKPSMAVEVRPGYAVDPGGHDVLVDQVQVKNLDTNIFRAPATVYLVVRYKEEETDWVELKIQGFPESAGYARISERFVIDWTIAEPDPRKELELCRVHLSKDTQAIRTPVNPELPRSGEIDMRFVRYAQQCHGWLGAVPIDEIRAFLLDAIATYTHLGRTRNMPAASACAAGCVTLLALAEARMLDQPLLADLLDMLGKIANELPEDAEFTDPRLLKSPHFSTFVGRTDQAAELLASLAEMDPFERVEATKIAMASQAEGITALRTIVRPPDHWKIPESALEPGKAIRVLDGTDWDRIKEDSSMPRKRMIVENQEWRLVDWIDLLDPDSESEHHFEIHEAVDWFRSQVSLKYPDQAVIKDEGIGHEGGYATWEVHNVTPGLPVVIVRRMDYARADYLCNVWVNDLPAGEVPCAGQDTRYRWRNWPFYIHGHYIRHAVLRLKQSIETANRDVNYFQLWFYQPV